MNHKYIRNVTNTEATIELFNEIGGFGIQGVDFANEMNFLAEIGIDTINIRINSPGGMVLDGITIFNSIQNARNKGKTVNTHIDGLAASIAGVLAMAGERRFMNDFGQFMAHLPFISDEDASRRGMNDSDMKAINAFTEMITTIFVSNTLHDEDEIRSMLSAETWLNAVDALKMGFVDEIVDTGRATQAKNMSVVEVYNTCKELIKRDPVKKVAKTQNKMITVINALELNEQASESAVHKAVNTLIEQVKEVPGLKSEIKILQDLIGVKDLENEALRSTTAEALVNQGITNGQLGDVSADKKVELIDSAKKDPKAFQNMLSLVPVKAVKIGVTNGPTVLDGIPSDRTDWTWSKWSTEDWKGLENIMNKYPATHDALFKAEKGIEYSKVSTRNRS